MKKIKYFLMLCFVFTGIASYAQNNKPATADTAITFAFIGSPSSPFLAAIASASTAVVGIEGAGKAGGSVPTTQS